MARRKTLPEDRRLKQAISARLAALRYELYGDRGGPELARRLGLPHRSWYNYEEGVTVPGEVILRFIELTSAEPLWLLHGRDPKFRDGSSAACSSLSPPTSVEALVRAALNQLEAGSLGSVWPGPGQEKTKEEAIRWHSVEDDAMTPVIAPGGMVAFTLEEEPAERLDGKLVAALIDGQPVIRWFHHHGRFAVLRAAEGRATAAEIVIDLEKPAGDRWFRRVVRVITPH